jgi:hypothetical protein
MDAFAMLRKEQLSVNQHINHADRWSAWLGLLNRLFLSHKLTAVYVFV